MRKLIWGTAGMAVLLILLGWLLLARPAVAPRVYKIGWGSSPPFQVRGPDGRPTGLAVDLIRIAARRRGIRLEWVYWTNTSEAALRGKKVDLWPIIAITPERLKSFHISEPFLEAEYCFLVRDASPHHKAQDLATATIGLTVSPIDIWHLRQHMPQARPLPQLVRSLVMEDLCRQRSDAAFMDSFTAIATLMDKRESCGDEVLRWIGAPEIRSRFGIGAPFETQAVADALRDEIGALSAERKLAPILSQWGYMSQQLESMEVLLDARRHVQRLAAAVVLFALLFLLALWQSVRILRERNRTLRAEGALRDTEQKLRLMANNMKEVVLAFDMNRRLIFANPAVETLTGYLIADLAKGGFVNWIHPDDQPRMLKHWEELFRGGAFEGEEYRLITRDGQTKWASATWGPIRDLRGEQIGVQGNERDITEQKRAGEALRESELRFRGLLQRVQLAAAIFDTNGKYVFANDYLLAITGWSREEMIGHHASEFLPVDQHANLRRLIRELNLSGEPAHWFAETPFLTREGKLRWLQVNNVVLRGSDGKLAAVASLGADVTEHRELQEQYVQSQKLESLGTLAGGVAHDFNNLLTVINGYSDLAFRSLPEGDTVRSKIDQIRKAGDKAAELTQQLLAFSRRQITQPRPFDLNRILDESGAMFRALLGDAIDLDTNLSPGLGLVMADPGQMHRVLMNLLANARDAMSGGGKLTVETRNVEPVAELGPGPCVLLAVKDTGAGIDEETRAHLFEPFFTTKGQGKGTGLGLSTVYGIVKQSGGCIRVHSEAGKGTMFAIYLPRIGGEPEASEKAHIQNESRNCETVLIVEDQKEVLGLATAVLKSLGYHVLGAADGPAALTLAADYSGPIHLVLTDVVLPGMNGKQVAESLKAARPEIAILYTSGYPQDVIAHRGVLNRDVAYIAKPYSPRDLADKIREVLER